MSRAYDIEAGETLAQKRDGVGLSRSDTAADAFGRIVTDCREHLMTNVPPVADHGDTEGIHQMRVGIRRLDSAMEVFRGAVEWPADQPLRAELTWLRRTLAPARDADVFTLETLPEIRRTIDANGAIEDIAHTVEEFRQSRHDAVIAALRSDRFERMYDTLDRWIDSAAWRKPRDRRRQKKLEKPVAKLSRKALDRLEKKSWARGHNLKELSPAQRHKMRLRLKKLRYAGESLASLYDPDDARRYLRGIKKVQDRLGAMNDAVTARSILAQATRDYPEVIRAPGLRLLAQWQEMQTRHLIGAGTKACRKLSELPPFWRAGV